MSESTELMRGMKRPQFPFSQRSLSGEAGESDVVPSGLPGGSLGPSGVQVPASGIEKRPLRLVRHSLERFTKVIEFELENATQHEAALGRQLQNGGEGGSAALRRELAGASSCLQRLRDHLRQLEKLRRVVQPSDLKKFDDAVAEHEAMARERLLHFTVLYERSRAARLVLSRDTSPTADAPAQMPLTAPVSEPAEAQQQLQAQMQAEDEEDEAMLEAWDQLADDLEMLEQLMAEMSQQVHEQGAQVDSIADNVGSARFNMLSSVRHLAAASKLKYAMAPLAGAAVGSLVAGPVGFIVGAKMGAAAGLVGGGMVGLAGGGLARKLHRRKTDSDMLEMQRRLQTDGDSREQPTGDSSEQPTEDSSEQPAPSEQ